MSKDKSSGIKLLAQNKKAYHDYFIVETLECGMSLKGNEVKSIKDGKISIKEAWIKCDGSHFILKDSFVSAWGTSNSFDIDERKDRVLLAHKEQIRKWASKVKLEGYTLIPLKVYSSKGLVKIEIGLAKGKHNYDKREALKKKEASMRIKEVV